MCTTYKVRNIYSGLEGPERAEPGAGGPEHPVLWAGVDQRVLEALFPGRRNKV